MNVLFILDENRKPIPEPDAVKWGQWFSKMSNRVVGHDHIGPMFISTIFVGVTDITRNPYWETMIFDGDCVDESLSDYQERCTGSCEQAEAMHKKAVDLATAAYEKLTI